MSFPGYLGCQVFYGCAICNITVYGNMPKADCLSMYHNFRQEHGAPGVLERDTAKKSPTKEVQFIQHGPLIKDKLIESNILNKHSKVTDS